MSRARDSSYSDDERDRDRDRGRTREKPKISEGLSSYYRSRFGSTSPEEYMNLRISGFDDKLERDEIKEILGSEFKRFAPFEIKVVRNEGERMAYVNFEKRDYARKIRHNMMDRLKKIFGRRVLCDPTGILRDQEGKYIPDRFNRALQTERDRRRPSPDRKRAKEPAEWRLKQEDTDATRTLFVGNMPADIRENEIRKIFERYGHIEDIDIKTPLNTDAAYAFVMFQTLEHAMDAKHGEHDRCIRSGSSRCKIGYGKSQPSRRLWVGGLGEWTSEDLLAKEFDRYGLIEKLEYDEGAEFAYIRFADLNAAQDACRGMKNFPLGGKDKHIMVDYAKDDTKEKEPSSSRKRKASRSPQPSPSSSPKRPAVKTFEDLDEEYAWTWQGKVLLKKTEYPLKLYRVAGFEKLIERLLRDDDGESVVLHVSQRLTLANQKPLIDRLCTTSQKQIAVMIAVGKPSDELKPIVRYLKEKQAAGVAMIPGGVLYIFSSGDVSSKLLQKFAPNVSILTDSCPYLLFVLGVRESESRSPNSW